MCGSQIFARKRTTDFAWGAYRCRSMLNDILKLNGIAKKKEIEAMAIVQRNVVLHMSKTAHTKRIEAAEKWNVTNWIGHGIICCDLVNGHVAVCHIFVAIGMSTTIRCLRRMSNNVLIILMDTFSVVEPSRTEELYLFFSLRILHKFCAQITET